MTPAMPLGRPSTWFVLALGAGFTLLGVGFLVRPDWGAALFGIPAEGASALLYAAAIGLRDVGLGLAILVLALAAGRRPLALMLGAMTVIPLGDVAVVALARGLSGHLLLHGAGALVLASTAAWLIAQPPPSSNRPETRKP
jgi:hypothetical protein